jgi:hypothetical protein
MIHEHDPVVLLHDLPAQSLKAGDVGVVVHVHQAGAAFEVEFLTLAGETAAIETLRKEEVREVRADEMPQARERVAA